MDVEYLNSSLSENKMSINYSGAVTTIINTATTTITRDYGTIASTTTTPAFTKVTTGSSLHNSQSNAIPDREK
eukprot:Pgem_evm1s14762